MALGSLEVELLSAIFEYLDEESPNTIKSVSLVNKYLYLVTHRSRYRRQTLDISESSRWRLSVLLAKPEALRSIRHLTIVGNDANGESLKRFEVRSIAKLVQDVAHLRSLVWRYLGPIPREILDALHQYQRTAVLSVYDWCRELHDADHNDPAEIALAHSPALVSLQARIWNGPALVALQGSIWNDQDLREAACKRIIANAPNLQYASVTTGRSGGMARMRSTADQVALEEKEELFYTHKQPNRSLRTLTLDGYGVSKRTLDQWGRFLDFSVLESLKCSRGFVPDKSYFELAPTLLKSLKHISLNFSYNKDADVAAAADNYLATCSPLETLSLWSWMNVISLPSILKHGPTLKTLQLHERESTDPDLPRGLLTAVDVDDIGQACPILEDFTMDFGNEEADNQAICEGLAQLSLDKVQLYFELGIAARISQDIRPTWAPEDASESSDLNFAESDCDSPPPKRVKQSTAEDTVRQAKGIWRTIFGQRRTGERALDIKLGEWERKVGTGYPAEWVTWEQENRSYLKLRPHERDDMLDVVVLTCQGGLLGKI